MMCIVHLVNSFTFPAICNKSLEIYNGMCLASVLMMIFCFQFQANIELSIGEMEPS